MTKHHGTFTHRRRGRVTRAVAGGFCGLAVAVTSMMPAHADHILPAEMADKPAEVVADNRSTPAPSACTTEKQSLVTQSPAAIDQLGIEKAWQISRGKVKVAVVDSGVDATNVHFADKLGTGYDVLDGGDGRTDVAGHGTAVAGLIAAKQVDGSGLVGLAPDAEILPIRVYERSDNDQVIQATRGPEPTHTAQGILKAAELGAKVIVVSMSVPDDQPEMRDAVAQATRQGALVVASAGNIDEKKPGQGDDTTPQVPRYPAAYPETLSVTAVDMNGAPSETEYHGSYIDVAAPGMSVLTTHFGAGDCVIAGETPRSSYANGYVGAVAALVAAAYPDETPADWKYRILATALRPARSMRNDEIGWGLVAPYSALTFTNDGAMPGPSNPRFPAAPSTQEVPAMPPPSARQDPRPERALILGVIAGIGCVATLAALTASRLRSDSQMKSRR